MTSAPTMATAKRLRTHDRLLLHLSWGLVLAVFLSIGWMAMKPWDPHGAVSLLSHGDPVLMVVEVLGRAAVLSALVAVVAGRRARQLQGRIAGARAGRGGGRATE